MSWIGHHCHQRQMANTQVQSIASIVDAFIMHHYHCQQVITMHTFVYLEKYQPQLIVAYAMTLGVAREWHYVDLHKH